MKKLSCPSCGADVVFQSSVSIFAVCAFCRSTIVRNDMNLAVVGKMAELKQDASPLQLGTAGKWRGDFELLGRVRATWEDGYWDEWFVRFGDGREGWLAEAQGFYMMSFPVDGVSSLPTVAQLQPGLAVTIGKTPYVVDDIKAITYSYAEGELPFAAPQGLEATSVDLVHGESDFASLSYAADGDVDAYVGQYVDFDDLHLQNLREIDGW